MMEILFVLYILSRMLFGKHEFRENVCSANIYMYIPSLLGIRLLLSVDDTFIIPLSVRVDPRRLVKPHIFHGTVRRFVT